MQRLAGVMLGCRGWQTLGAVATTGIATWLLRLPAGINVTTVGFVYLLIVLAAASVYGLPEAVVASLAAAAQYNFFFLPPIGTFTIDDSRNWVALGAFLATALAASELSARARRREREAEARRLEISRLYELSRAGLLAAPGEIVPHLERALVALFDCGDARIVAADAAGLLPAGGVRLTLRVGQRDIGQLWMQSPRLSEESGAALASIIAIVLERARSLREALQSALLDSVTHELRTPLTSIKAAASALVASPGAETAELVAVINEESDRLNRILQSVLDMARIRAGGLAPRLRPEALPAIFDDAIGQARVSADRVRVDAGAELPLVRADGALLSQAMAQLLANAAAYSPPGSPIEVAVQADGAMAKIRVRDRGPGIAPELAPRLFEKFFRDDRARTLRPEGLGMGLAIARGIIEAHGGELRVEPAAGTGAQFWFTVPLATDARATTNFGRG